MIIYLRIPKKSSTFAALLIVEYPVLEKNRNIGAKSSAKIQQKIRMCKKIVKKAYFLLIAVLFSGAVNAKVNNYIGAYVNAGEWSLMPKQSEYSTSYGAAGGLGFLYEMQAGRKYAPTRFLLDIGVGAQGGLTAFTQGNSMEVRLPNQYDLDGDVFDYVYELSDRKDQYTDVAVQVPVLFGVQHRHFYMLAGVKVGAHLYTKAYSKANLRTYGDYQKFDPFVNMPEYQFFEGLSIDKSANASFNLTMDASLEVGGRLGFITDAVGYDVPKRVIECRLAGFVDYGLLDIHRQRELPGLVPSTNYIADEAYKSNTMIDGLLMNDVMSTAGFAKSVNSLTVGIKFTVLFQLPEPGQCVICRDAYVNSARSGGDSKGMKYEE